MSDFYTKFAELQELCIICKQEQGNGKFDDLYIHF